MFFEWLNLNTFSDEYLCNRVLYLILIFMELTVDQALQQGVAAHKAGNLKEAEKLYRAILSTQNHPDANHNLYNSC